VKRATNSNGQWTSFALGTHRAKLKSVKWH